MISSFNKIKRADVALIHVFLLGCHLEEIPVFVAFEALYSMRLARLDVVYLTERVALCNVFHIVVLAVFIVDDQNILLYSFLPAANHIGHGKRTAAMVGKIAERRGIAAAITDSLLGLVVVILSLNRDSYNIDTAS